ncbi:MAG: large subunit ribosomal protein [Candidatus Thermoplasmatota archaeon]|nr:large subunit ribosomal protein [Candidatus Thermoplasmatota archaeon]
MAEKLEVLVDGGKATPGPPLGPSLGPLGVNVIQVVNAINEKTKAFAGMKVPVTLTVDSKTKSFEIKVGTPPTSALILKEIKVEKGSGSPKATKVGNLSIQQALKIAEMKKDSMLGKSKKERFKEVVGTCVSMGVTVDNKEPKQVIKEIEAGGYAGVF